MDENWDLTMQRIIPFVNGVNSIKKIAALADADLRFTAKCVKHLIYYGCALLLDVFSFNAIYAPTAGFGGTIARDEEMQKECARYVNMAFAPGSGGLGGSDVAVQSFDANSALASADVDVWPLTANGEVVDGVGIVRLFASLRQGLDVRAWYTQNTNMLANIDIRRFLTFGVIKGFLYRVHRYAYATGVKKNGEGRRTGMVVRRERDPIPRSMSSEWQLKEVGGNTRRYIVHGSSDEEGVSNARLKEYLDGTHCFDEICTELEISEKELEEKLKKGYPEEVLIICR